MYGSAGFPNPCSELAVVVREGYDANHYYEIFGISTDATLKQIRQAYTRLAKESHPDHGGKIEDFRAYTQIYETLSDPVKRQAYDNVNPAGGVMYLGDIEVERLKLIVPQSMWKQFQGSTAPAPQFSYYAYHPDDQLAREWFEVLVPAYQVLRMHLTVRISLEDVPMPSLRRFSAMANVMVIPTSVKPSFFVALLLVQALKEEMGMI